MKNSIHVEKLSKQYQIGELHRETMLRDRLVSFVKHPSRKKNVETIWALKDVSFSVRKGELIGVIGRNGAGKSTLLKILSKITYPTSGKMRIHGRVASLLEVGTGFHEELTGRENIYLNGSILGMTKKEINSKLDQIIEFAGVDKFIDTPIKRYSSGMRLRLGFSVAAHLDTEVLLVDEVLAVGDAQFQKKCIKTMSDITGSGRTVLFVSHNMSAIENLCSRTIWIDAGTLRNDGNTKDTISTYLSTYAEQSDTNFDLTNLKTRGGSGQIRLTKLEFLNSHLNHQKILRCGEKMVARLYYKATESVKEPHFSIELFTDFGTRVTSINSWSAGVAIPNIEPGDGYIEVEIQSVNLLPGSFYMSLWIASVGNIFYDKLDHFGRIDIESSDFYGSGRGMDSRQFGLVALPSKWKLVRLANKPE